MLCGNIEPKDGKTEKIRFITAGQLWEQYSMPSYNVHHWLVAMSGLSGKDIPVLPGMVLIKSRAH